MLLERRVEPVCRNERSASEVEDVEEEESEEENEGDNELVDRSSTRDT